MRNIKILLALFAIVSLSFSCTTYENSGGGSGGGSNTRVVSKLIFEDIEDDSEYFEVVNTFDKLMNEG
jgi:hypothetical protein